MATSVLSTPYAIDSSRVFYKKPSSPQAVYDHSCPDSVWVAVIGHDMENIMSSAAKTDVVRYVTEAVGPCDGIDMEEGPVPDDGKSIPANITVGNSPDARVTMSAAEYMNMAAKRQLQQKGVTRYVGYYRVRRLALI